MTIMIENIITTVRRTYVKCVNNIIIYMRVQWRTRWPRFGGPLKKSYKHYLYIIIIKVGTRKRTDMRYYLLLYIYRQAPRGGRQSADTGDWVGNTALSDQWLGAIDRWSRVCESERERKYWKIEKTQYR